MQLKVLLVYPFFMLFFLINTNLKAQKPTSKTSFLEKTDFKIGYFGSLIWNNGLSIGAEYTWKENIKIKERKSGQKTIIYQLLWNGSIGYTTNFSIKMEDGLITHYGVILRRVNPKGRLLNLEVNPLGYYRSFLPSTYEVSGNEVFKVRLPGRGYYAPSIALGIGKYRKGKTRTGWYLNLRYYMRTPINGGRYSMIELEYGHRFNFKNK